MSDKPHLPTPYSVDPKLINILADEEQNKILEEWRKREISKFVQISHNSERPESVESVSFQNLTGWDENITPEEKEAIFQAFGSNFVTVGNRSVVFTRLTADQITQSGAIEGRLGQLVTAGNALKKLGLKDLVLMENFFYDEADINGMVSPSSKQGLRFQMPQFLKMPILVSYLLQLKHIYNHTYISMLDKNNRIPPGGFLKAFSSLLEQRNIYGFSIVANPHWNSEFAYKQILGLEA